MNKTKIEWVKNPDGTQGFTWNPITGCLNGCEYCYARKLAYGRLRARYLANTNFVREVYQDEESLYVKGDHDPFYPRFWEDRLYHAWGGKPKGIFVCDMSDLFGIGIPEEWTYRVITQMRAYPYHRLYLLTKQPQNLIKFSPFPENCYVGVTAVNTRAMTQAMTSLARVEASVKYISFEPLLSQMYIMPEDFKVGGISWVIIGAMTCGGNKIAEFSFKYPELIPMPYGNRYTLEPKTEWVEGIVSACDKAGIPVFLKDNLLPVFDGIGVLPWYRGNYRQEMPVKGEGSNEHR